MVAGALRAGVAQAVDRAGKRGQIHLRKTLTNRQPTTVGLEITIDYAKSVLTMDGKSFAFPPLSPAAQELIVAGGAEKLVASRLRSRS